jgi:DNA-binding CsgD family transcriptional regulator/PAS domain-containing protein
MACADFSVLGSIYSAAIDETLWPDVLNSYAPIARAKGATLVVVDNGDQPWSLSAFSGCFDRMQAHGEFDHYTKTLSHHEADGWTTLQQQPRQKFLLDNDIWPNIDELRLRPDICYLREKAGIFRKAAARLNDNRAWFDGLAVQFDAAVDDIPFDALAQAEPFLPHFAKALEMGRAFAILRARYEAVLQVLDRVQVGICIALAGGEIIVANRNAERILKLGDGVWLSRSKRIEFQNPDLTRAVETAIGIAALTARGHENRPESLFEVPRPSGAHSFLVEISPLNDSLGELDRDLVGAVVTLIDPDDACPLNVDKFAKIYGLTTAEEVVCQHLMNGWSGDRIAEARSVSRETVRSQIKSVLRKSGVSSRADLTRMIVKTVPPIE